MSTQNSQQGAPNRGRKFAVVIIVSVQIVLLAVYAAIAALHGVDVSWVGGVMMTFGSVYPAYMGANALQKSVQAKTKDNKNMKGGV